MSVRRGAVYVNALRDGREVWHAGQRITDVTAHAALQERSKLSRTFTTSNISPSIGIS